METQISKLSDYTHKPSEVARKLGLSVTAIGNWIKHNAVPPKRVIALANALDVEIHELLIFAERKSTPVKTLKKERSDLDALLAAYEGRPYTSALPDSAIKTILTHWGDRLPLMVETLKALDARALSPKDAAERLGLGLSTVHNLRRRYGMAPGSIKAKPKADGRYKLTAKKARPVALDIIKGRMSVVKAAETSGISKRTLHRYVERVLRPQTLNEISAWSPSFRSALAWEIDKKMPRHAVAWRKWAESRHLLLTKTQKRSMPVKSWREASLRRMLIAYLNGEISLEELAQERGGDAAVIEGLFRAELARMNMEPLTLSLHHQAAVAEILLVMESHFRSRGKE
jgi:ParB-like chromosome segregation protein Spo0J